MAEKEERILISKIPFECKFRELHETSAGGHTLVDFMCGKYGCNKTVCDAKCFLNCAVKEYIGISRQEAIEKMAKAICAKKHCKDVCNNCEVWLHFKDCAEAALNALLEGK